MIGGLAAVVAMLWIALVAVGLPPPERRPLFGGIQFGPRSAVLGAVAITTLFVAVACRQSPLASGPGFGLRPSGQFYWHRVSDASRTLSSGSGFLVVTVGLVSAATWLGARSRIAARSAMALGLALLAWAMCSPLSESGIGAWSRALAPVAPWGAPLAVAGVGVGLVRLRLATNRGDATGREAACAVIACCGLVAVGLAVLVVDGWAAWQAEDVVHCSPGCVRIPYGPFAGSPVPARPGLPAMAGAIASAVLGLVAAVFGGVHLRDRRSAADAGATLGV